MRVLIILVIGLGLAGCEKKIREANLPERRFDPADRGGQLAIESFGNERPSAIRCIASPGAIHGLFEQG